LRCEAIRLETSLPRATAGVPDNGTAHRLDSLAESDR
jgi:hypothetical protein